MESRPNGTRKDIAIYFQKFPEVQSICFAMLDKKNYEEVIWNKLRPQRAVIFRKISPDEM
jgi:hypothetical protein